MYRYPLAMILKVGAMGPVGHPRGTHLCTIAYGLAHRNMYIVQYHVRTYVCGFLAVHTAARA